MEFRLGGLYLHEMKDLRGNGATLAEVLRSFQICHKKRRHNLGTVLRYMWWSNFLKMVDKKRLGRRIFSMSVGHKLTY